MKNLKLKPLNLLYNVLVLMVVFAFTGINILFAIPAGLVFGIVLGFAKSKSFEYALFMAIQKEIWEDEIESNLYSDNKFLSTFKAADKENIQGRTVHIPQAGIGGDVVKNRTQLPATVKTRTDTIVSYQINEFTSDPMRVEHKDGEELSYDKMNDIMEDDRAKLNESVAEDVLMSIVKAEVGTDTNLPATSILTTDSATTVAATAPEATGLRKAYAIGNFQKARNFFIRQKRWTEGNMWALITPDAESQVFPADSIVTATYMASVTEEERRAGVMYKVQGFKIMVRDAVYVLNNAGAFKPRAAAGAATDDEGIVFYNGNAVEFALGDIEFFENYKDATYFASICSFLVRCGARARRKAFEGILVFKQGKAV